VPLATFPRKLPDPPGELLPVLDSSAMRRAPPSVLAKFAARGKARRALPSAPMGPSGTAKTASSVAGKRPTAPAGLLTVHMLTVNIRTQATWGERSAAPVRVCAAAQSQKHGSKNMPKLARSLGDQIANTLRGEILSGRMPEGQSLQESILAARFGVSRGPVRDAILELTKEGILTPRRSRGVTVAGSAPEFPSGVCIAAAAHDRMPMPWGFSSRRSPKRTFALGKKFSKACAGPACRRRGADRRAGHRAAPLDSRNVGPG